MNRRDFLRAIAAAPTIRVAGKGEGVVTGIVAIGRRVTAWLERRGFARAMSAMAGMIGCALDAIGQLAVHVKTTAEDMARFAEQMRSVIEALRIVCEEYNAGGGDGETTI